VLFQNIKKDEDVMGEPQVPQATDSIKQYRKIGKDMTG
jgi:hypothetical protein